MITIQKLNKKKIEPQQPSEKIIPITHQNIQPPPQKVDTKPTVQLPPQVDSKLKAPQLLKEVTIIVPCYNQSTFLRDAIDSCIHQTYSLINIIVLLMDKESQKLKDTVASLDPRIRVICSGRKLLPSARNFCFGLATTEYVIPLDADDTLPLNFVENVCKIDADIVYVGSNYFGTQTGRWPPSIDEEIDWDKQTTLRRNPIVCTALIRRSAWAAVGGYSDTLTAYEDMEFWIRLHKHGFIFKKCFSVCLNYRKHAETSMLKGVSSNPGQWKPLYAEVINLHSDWYDHIPKIIHYVWIGNKPKPTELIDTWKSYLGTDWEVKEWNETNLDLTTHGAPRFLREAVAAGKYGIAVDPIRAYLLYTYGGFWLDTDCLLTRDITPFCQYDFIVGYESASWLNVGLVGARKGSFIMKDVLTYYQTISFTPNIFYDINKFITNIGTGPQVLTRIMQKYESSVALGDYIFPLPNGFVPNGMPQTLIIKDEKVRIEPACVFVLNDSVSGAVNFALHLYNASWTDKVGAWADVVRREYERWKKGNNIIGWRG